jgi:hypothetical protein
MRFGGEGILRLAGGAVVARRQVIGVDGRHVEPGRRYSVPREREHRVTGHEERDGLSRRVCAAIEYHARLVRGDAAIAVEARPKSDARGVPRIRDLELVGVTEDRAHRPAGRAREEHERMLVERKPLSTEVAADVRRVHDDLLDRHADRERELVAQRERRLVRRDDVDHLALGPHQRRARLDVRLVQRHGELVLEDARGAREAGRDVAVLVPILALHVRCRRAGRSPPM